ncbi:cysteine desulfurase NifS [Desulfitibacter alkalitolerans]|uniref:cysteine desulfurase NifS n=1 Tax=Desulfitibacter alkalitolerans TaxID=264641 RepID=UPI000489B932|nr:cysteine desulfurase NifS [Desulfitibacter alkalitolerans]
MRKVYLDHSATTPVRKEVADLVVEYMVDKFGNPSSIHSFGREARKALDEARERLANLIGAEPKEIYFTSGGTESDNIAILGAAFANSKKGKHIITSAIEHHAVMDPCKYLEKQGYEVTYLPVDDQGIISIADLEKAIKPETILITIMHVNNEIGTIQDIGPMAKLAKDKGILFHTDAVQSLGKVHVNVNELNVDMLSGSSHKIYGPKGVGVLYIRKGVKLDSIMYGGVQERKKRPGTENLSGIVGFGLAAELAGKEIDEENDKQSKLRDKLINGILENIPHTRLNGHSEKRIASNVNVSIEFVEGESLLLSLDMRGIGASSGSACTSGSLDPSHVLLAMGLSHEIAHGSLRMTLGRETTEEDIDYVLEALPQVVDRLRAMSPLYNKKK